MGSRTHRHVGLVAAVLVAAAGCMPGPGVPVGVKGSRKPGVAATRTPASVAPVATGALAKAIAGLPTRLAAEGDVALVATRLTGKVKLLANNGAGIISDNGGGIISNNSGAIISDNGGGIISDNGGGIVANNGGGLTSKTKYGLTQAAKPAEFGLADAIITVRDAAGRVLLDATGAPITATTDRQGGYVLAGDLPAENLVIEIKLWQGGTLQAMVAKDGAAAPIDLDTASSIGAAYVLGQYVQGRQATYDKLPGAEAARLHQALDEARALVTAAPRYDGAELVALAEVIRAQAPAVDRSLGDIKAILLGQANLGAGRQADTVPLQGPRAMAVAKDGTLYVVEGSFGRIRAIAPDGTISTFADAVRGVVKQNFATAHDLLAAPDGSLYVSTPTDGRVWRIKPDRSVEVVAGLGVEGRASVDVPATSTPLSPQRLALGPDGTLHVGEGRTGADDRPRVFTIGADGVLRLAFEGKLAGMGLKGLGLLPDGGYAYLEVGGPDGTYLDRVRRRSAAGDETDLPAPDTNDWLVTAPDGTIYFTEGWQRRVAAVRPDGTTTIVAGPGGTAAGSEGLVHPVSLALGPDGALYVLDDGTNTVNRVAPDGRSWRTVAGTAGAVRYEGDVGAVALNGPVDVAIAPDGAMVVSENESGLVKRFDGKAFSTLVGGMSFQQAVPQVDEVSGEGLPGLGAHLRLPRGLAFKGDELLIADTGNVRIRALAADGTLRTRIGPPGLTWIGDGLHQLATAAETVAPGATQAPAEHLFVGSYVAVGPDGLLYWTTGKANQLLRQRADGRVEPLSDAAPKGADLVLGAFAGLADGSPAAGWKPAFPCGLAFDPKGDLYVAEVVTQQIRKVTGLATGAPTVSTFAGASLTALAMRPDMPSGDGGPALDAPILAPTALCFDGTGNLYVAEVGTRAAAQLTTALGSEIPLPPGMAQVDARIRKITPEGIISTVAGPGGKFFPDPTAEDALVMPTGLAVDAQGRLYIADAGSNLVRILPAGRF